MMRNTKIKWFSFLMLLLLGVFAEWVYPEQDESGADIPVDIVTDGEKTSRINMLLLNKMGYLKGDDVAAVFGADMLYDKNQGNITFSWQDRSETAGEQDVVFRLQEKEVLMEGIKRKMMKCPLIYGGKVYIPLEAVITRAFENVVKAQISWSFPEKKMWISYKGNIADIRHYTYDKYTRLVLELTQDLISSNYEKDGQIMVSIEEGEFASPVPGIIEVNDGVIKKMKVYKKRGKVVIGVIRGENAGKYTVKKLPGPVRIIVDIENKAVPKKDKPVSKPDKSSVVMKPAGPAKRNKTNIDDIKLVIIDPGHGGKDPGAIGPRGTKEKDITLQIAKKLARKIRKKLKIATVLTRTNDTFIPLAARTNMANSKDADLFISIHVNASLNPDSRGFEVYFLSEDVSDKEAQAVANMENSVMAMEDKSKEMSRVSKILWSLTMNQFMNESSELCGLINTRVIRRTGLINRGVKQAGFYVMRGARMPAVLVEAAFLSNSREEKMLNKGSFQDKVVDGICDAVLDYKRWVSVR